jgi:hypothetical protein
MAADENLTGVALLNKVVREEIEKNPEDFMDNLYEIARRKIVQEHNNDMMTAVGLLFLSTKHNPTSPTHQVALDLMRKYNLPQPPNVKTSPGAA